MSVHTAQSPLHRIERGAKVLASIFVLAVLGYRFLGGYDWTDAIWMVVVTISTVGFSEHSELDWKLQLYTVGVILVGISASVYTFGGFFQLMVEGELERLIGKRRMEREIELLSGHIVLCGYGRMGEHLAHALYRQGKPFVVIESDAEKVAEVASDQMLCFHGDATEEDVLEAVRVKHAKTLVTTLPSDAASVFITLTARNLNPELQIIARAELQSTEQKLRQAGANKVILPTVIGAQQAVRMITRPSTADLMELVAESSFNELDLEEFVVPDTSLLIGKSVRETDANRRHRVLVIAIKHADGKMAFNPNADHRFRSLDTIMLMGHTDDIIRFREEYRA